MHQTDSLFTLIRSLTSSEKRYFTIQIAKDASSSNSSTLFRAFVEWNLATYDENLFVKKHADKLFVKNYAYEKNYLYEMILKTMRSFHSGKSAEIQISEMIIDIQFLYDKGLTEQAHKLIKKALDLAKKHQYYNEILVLSKYKQILVSDGMISIDLNIYKKEIKETLHHVNRRFLLYCDRIDILQLLEKPDWRKNIVDIQKIVEENSVLLKNEPLSVYERDLILNTLTFYYNKTNDFEKLYNICSENIKNQESKKEKTFYKSKKLLTMFSNLLHAVFMTEKFEEYAEVMEKVKQIPLNTEIDKANFFSIYVGYELMYHLNMKDYKKNDTLAVELETGLKKYKNLISVSTYVQFIFNLSLLYFFDGEFKKTQLQHTKLYDLISRDVKFHYINALCRTIELMCIYSENDWTIIDHSLRAWKRLVDHESMRDDIFDSLYDLFKCVKKETFSSSKIDDLTNVINNTDCKVQWAQLKVFTMHWIELSRASKTKKIAIN